MAPNKHNDIFISYNWDSQPDVLKLKEFLTENKYTVWMDLAYLRGGSVLMDELQAAITTSKVFISCITRKYATSDVCKKELNYAINIVKKPIIPILFENVSFSDLGGVGFQISDRLSINMYTDDNVKREWSGSLGLQLLNAVEHALERAKPALPTDKHFKLNEVSVVRIII